MNAISLLDGLVLAVLIIAVLRGAYIGMIREGFSIAALAAGCIAVRYLNADAAAWLTELTRGEIGAGAAPWITGALILVASIGVVGIFGRAIKLGARAVGLGWADRVGGSALGAAEGTLVAAILVSGAVFVLGRDHPELRGARSVEAVDQLQEYVLENYEELPAVGTRPRR